MLIEHDGKTIDTEREIRFRGCHTPVIFVGRLRNGGLIFEWGDNCWDVHSNQSAVMKFENVPQTHEMWFVVNPCNGYTTEKEAKDKAYRLPGYIVARAEWES